MDCVCEVYSQITPEKCEHVYTHADTYSVCTYVCVFISPFPLTKRSKGEYFWGAEISFVLLSVKHKGILRSDLERLSDVSYQGALYLLEGTTNLEIVKIFK